MGGSDLDPEEFTEFLNLDVQNEEFCGQFDILKDVSLFAESDSEVESSRDLQLDSILDTLLDMGMGDSERDEIYHGHKDKKVAKETEKRPLQEDSVPTLERNQIGFSSNDCTKVLYEQETENQCFLSEERKGKAYKARNKKLNTRKELLKVEKDNPDELAKSSFEVYSPILETFSESAESKISPIKPEKIILKFRRKGKRKWQRGDCRCPGCCRKPCELCEFCLDAPRNGGPSKLRKRCSERQCEFIFIGKKKKKCTFQAPFEACNPLNKSNSALKVEAPLKPILPINAGYSFEVKCPFKAEYSETEPSFNPSKCENPSKAEPVVKAESPFKSESAFMAESPLNAEAPFKSEPLFEAVSPFEAEAQSLFESESFFKSRPAFESEGLLTTESQFEDKILMKTELKDERLFKAEPIIKAESPFEVDSTFKTESPFEAQSIVKSNSPFQVEPLFDALSASSDCYRTDSMGLVSACPKSVLQSSASALLPPWRGTRNFLAESPLLYTTAPAGRSRLKSDSCDPVLPNGDCYSPDLGGMWKGSATKKEQKEKKVVKERTVKKKLVEEQAFVLKKMVVQKQELVDGRKLVLKKEEVFRLVEIQKTLSVKEEVQRIMKKERLKNFPRKYKDMQRMVEILQRKKLEVQKKELKSMLCLPVKNQGYSKQKSPALMNVKGIRQISDLDKASERERTRRLGMAKDLDMVLGSYYIFSYILHLDTRPASLASRWQVGQEECPGGGQASCPPT